MKNVLVEKESPLVPVVTIQGQKAITTSIDVARVFGKRHNNVIRDIGKLEIPGDFRLLNFEQSSCVNSQNKKQEMYKMTRDGFTILAMGFTGKRAMQFKIAYIQAFNIMEAELTGRPSPTFLSDEKTKRCTTCKQTKPVSSYWKNAGTHDGLQAQCKDCKRADAVEYRMRNRIKNTGRLQLETVSA